MLTELVLDNGCWNRERNVDDDLENVVARIGENVITVGTVASSSTWRVSSGSDGVLVVPSWPSSRPGEESLAASSPPAGSS